AQPKCVQTPSTTSTSGDKERSGFLQYSGCSDSSESGSDSNDLTDSKVVSISSVRLTTKIGLPRYLTTIICPASIEPISWVTAAPAASAFALGVQERTKGVATAATPAAPMTAVEAIRTLRRCTLTPSAWLINTSSRRMKWDYPTLGLWLRNMTIIKPR